MMSSIEDDQPAETEELEAGIAAVFAALRAAGEREDEPGDGAQTEGREHTPPIDSGATFELLGELDRLWHRPAA